MFEGKVNNSEEKKSVNEDFDLLSRNRDYINKNSERVAVQCGVKKIEIDDLVNDKNYRLELIEQDKKEVEEAFQKFIQKAISGESDSGLDFAFVNLQRNLSIIQEVITAKVIEDLEIFKQGVNVSLASEYDDTFNHTDVIAEDRVNVNYENSITTFDMTFSKTKVVEKLDKLESMTKFKGRPVNDDVKNYWELRYYKSDLKDMSGQIDFSPKLILGLSVKHVLELYQSYIDKNNQEDIGACLGLDKRLDYDFHPAKIILLEEMIAQADYLSACAHDKKNERIESRYTNLLLSLNNRLENLKRRYAEDSKGQKVLNELDIYRNEDQVYTSILKRINAQNQLLGFNKASREYKLN